MPLAPWTHTFLTAVIAKASNSRRPKLDGCQQGENTSTAFASLQVSNFCADLSGNHLGKRGKSEEDKKLHDYLIGISPDSHAALQDLQEESLRHPRALMLSPPDSVAILQLFGQLTNAKVAIEVGVFTGYTAVGLALVLPEDGKLYALDITDEFPSIGRPFWEQAGVAKKIDLRIGPAADSLDILLKELGPNAADIAFIDANKVDYDTYYEKLLVLVRPGGVIAVDNVLWGGQVIDDSDQTPDTQAIRALNAKIAKDKRVRHAVLKNSDGITIAVKL